MAEIEEAFDVIEEGEDALEGEGEEIEDENMSEAEKEELQNEIEKTKSNMQKLSEAASKFKEYATAFVKGPAREFVTFVVKNAAIGVILYGVNLAMAKLIKPGSGKSAGEKESIKKKSEKIQAITSLIQTENNICTAYKDWMDQHKQNTITLDGIELPVESVFYKYIKSIGDAVDKAYEAARPLQKKIGENISYEQPNAEDIAKMLDAAAAFIASFNELLKFIVKNTFKIPVLKSVPIKQADIDDLNSRLDTVKKMPFN